MTLFFKHLKFVMALFAVATFVTMPAQAQNEAATMQAQPQQNATINNAAAAEYSNATINAFAESMIKVRAVQQQAAPQMQQAQNDEQKRSVYQDMQQKMAAAVQNTNGISVQEYNSIAQEAQQDQRLAARIQTAIQSKVQ